MVVSQATPAPLRDRILYLDGGDLGAILPRLMGVVTINSTVGLTALRTGIPVIALGKAIYDIEGITHQEGLDRFWEHPEPPQAIRVAKLVAALQATIQVPGGFEGSGVATGANAVATKILARNPPYTMEEMPYT